MIKIKTQKEIEIMREGGKICAKIFEKILKEVRPGITTFYLEEKTKELIKKAKVKCAFLGYKGDNEKPYPACLCTSLNEELVHVPPSERVLKEGDVLKIDFGIFWESFYLDMARTVGVGKISFEAQRLIRVTKKALKLAIKKAKVQNTFGDIGNTIQRYVESQGFNVIRDLCGHGIGRALHEEPKILNFGKRETGKEIKEGMVFCIEPMVSCGDWKVENTKDGFGYKMKDNSLCAHFEDTVAITKRGTEVLTKID
jgi:methionyl aminopeptidase